ncbi:MAG: B12-binding domain-containing radical SAM protein [Acidobacteria bacterium]|nr:MAG: B12-binding domain-containing radical SAM protein [Acidobacteriota bacterium]RLE32349.1 MAG: B12-binding domain-containing radical SAM protein [Acidobacteriota bacterium]
MPRLTLIYPAIGRKAGRPFVRSWQLQPLALARLAAMTPPEWQITFMDDRVEILEYSPDTDLVGISIESYSAKRGYEIAARFRAEGVPVVLGGYHATLCPDEAGAHADAVCVGEAEGVWPEILEDSLQGRLKDRYDSDSRQALRGIEPDRRIFKGKSYLPVALVETSRGCPFHCDFCSIASVFRGSFRRRPVGEIVGELESLKEKYVFFVDDNIVGDPEAAGEFFDAITPLGFRWLSQASLHALRDDELIRRMARSGCIGLLVGFESLDPENLAVMGKQINQVELYRDALQALRRAGIFVYGTFIFGYPHDTAESFEHSLRFAHEEKLFVAAFNHLVPFPGTPLFKRLNREGRMKYRQWWLHDDYRFGQLPFEPEGMDSIELEECCRRLRREFYSWPSMLRRALEFRCNSRSPRRIREYWMLNLLLRRELSEKFGIELGKNLS